MLWNEIQQARKTQRYNKKRLEDLIYDITDSTDFFIVKVVKLFIALFVALGNARFENHIEELQEANRQLKAQARKVMQQSNDVSQTLKEKDIAKIVSALHEYENRLTTLSAYIDRTVNEVLTEQGERQNIR